MKKLFPAPVVAFMFAMAGPAIAADVLRQQPVEAFAPFTWTNCYLGAHFGGGWASKALTDPVQLAQDSFLFPGATTGVTVANVAPSGAVIGGQIGCDYQFAPTWVVGIEGAA